MKAGDVIGFAGTTGFSTGVHIHWETRWDRAWVGGRWVNPRILNPQTFKASTPNTGQEEDEDMAEKKAVAHTQGGVQTVIIGESSTGWKYKYTTKAMKGRNPENEKWADFFDTGDFMVVEDRTMLDQWELSLDEKRQGK